MTDQRRPHMLIDLLPNGLFYDDKENEAEPIEAINQGLLVGLFIVPAADYLDLLRARLGLASDELPTKTHWALLRYELQRMAQMYVESIALPRLGAGQQTIVREGAAGERPDMHALYARDASLGNDVAYQKHDDDTEEVEVDELGRTLDPQMGGYPSYEDLTPDERANYLGGDLEAYEADRDRTNPENANGPGE